MPGTPPFWPVTLTVLGTFHPVAPPRVVAKVSVAGDTEPASGSLLARFTVTGLLGAIVRTTVKVAVPPLRVVSRPFWGETKKNLLALGRLLPCSDAPMPL